MSIVWPPGLPQESLLAGNSETPPNTTLRTQMDTGPAKVRRRYTAAPRQFQRSVMLTESQVSTLDTFYVTTTAGGTSVFTWTHPRTGASVDFRFVSPPVYSALGGDLWRADMSLEILP